MSRYRLNFSLASILTLSRSGIKSRRAAFLMSLVFWEVVSVDSTAGSGAGAGSAVGTGSGIGSGAEVVKPGISTGATGVTGSGAGASTLGSGNGPTGSPSSTSSTELLV